MNSAAGNQLLKGHLHTLVLHLLADRGRMYGYEITKEVKERTAGQVQLTEGALYPVLHKLEGQGVLLTEIALVEGRARKYYRLNEAGSALAQSTQAQLMQELQSLLLIFNPPQMQWT